MSAYRRESGRRPFKDSVFLSLLTFCFLHKYVGFIRDTIYSEYSISVVQELTDRSFKAEHRP